MAMNKYIFLCLCAIGTAASERECVVPPSVNILPADETPESLDVLMGEGRCFLSCLYHEANLTKRNDALYPPWPFAVVKTSCGKHKVIHECTRGCYTWSTSNSGVTIGDCTVDCDRRCRDECGGNKCPNPDPLDLWLSKSNCDVTCSENNCEKGCIVGEVLMMDSIIPESMIGSGSEDMNVVPPSPVAPPSLILDVNASGLYEIHLQDAMPPTSGLGGTTRLPPVAFLFKIEDHVTSDTSYIWQNDPRKCLQLVRYSCRNITVSFTVVNRIGASSFSPTLTLMVDGDSSRIPNPPYDVTTEIHEDTRIGYFEHFILNVTWLTPLDDRYLDYFIIQLEAQNKDLASGRMVLTVNPSEDRFNSIILRSGTNFTDIPLVMTRSYLLTITSVGADDNRTVQPNTIITQALFTSSVGEFSCVRIWDGSRLFSFSLSWSIPLQWAQRNVATSFTMNPSSTKYPDGYSIRRINIMDNVTNYNYMLSGNEDFFRPLAGRFEFEILMDWNYSALYFDPRSIREVTCYADGTSLPPSAMRSFTIVSVVVQGRNRITVDFEWEPPTTINGELGGYNICISPRTLDFDEEINLQEGETQCLMAQSDAISITGTWNIYTEQCLYCQMRARNEFVHGNWTDPIQLEIEYCTDTTTTTTTTTATTTTTTATTTAPSRSTSLTTIITLVCVITFVLALILLLTCILIVMRLKKKRKIFLRRAEAYPVDSIFSINRETGRRPHPTTPTIEPLLMSDEWEVSPTEIIVQDCLGEGAFGEVYKGVLKGPISCSKVQPSLRRAVFTEVAIKLLKKSARGSERQDFFSEIETMKKVSECHNPHVVGMLGCVTLQEPLCLVTEFVRYGDLLSYLRTNRKMCTGSVPNQGGCTNIMDPYLQLGQLSSNDLLSFAYQIASAMEYLSGIDIVHRDLACRNILVDEGKVLKITDFGMSRETDEIYVQKSKGRVPFKWMATESIIAREFTSASDVWSYGITLWEIATLGGVPYPTIQNEDLLSLLNRGYRMEKPDNCSPEIYNIMILCWNKHPHQRPTFTDLRDKFDHLLLADHKGDYIEFSFDSSTSNLDGKERFLNISPALRRHSRTSSGHEECTMLLSDEKLNTDSQSTPPNNSSPHFSPRQQSPQQLSLRQCSPVDRLSPSCQSTGNQTTSEKSSPGRQWSPLKLLPGRQTRESISPQVRSPSHANDATAVEERENQERHRPMSMLLLRERDQARRKGELSDRYVKEPTKLANLSAADQDAYELRNSEENGDISPLRVRRGSEGTLNMNSDGYVSFIGVEYSRDRRANLPPPDIHITVTEDIM